MELIEMRDKRAKPQVSVLQFDIVDLEDFKYFLKSVGNHLIVGIRYSILIRVSYNDSTTNEYTSYKMVGPQICVILNNEGELLEKLQELYDTILYRLRDSMEHYNYSSYDVINIQLLVFTLEKVSIRTSKLTRDGLGDQKDLVNVSKVRESYKYTDNLSNLDNPGTEVRKYVNMGKVEKFVFNGETIKIENFFNDSKHEMVINQESNFYEKVVEGKRYLLIINGVSEIKVVYVFSKSGLLISKVTYKSLSQKRYTRTVDNVTLFIGDKGIYNKTIYKKFPSVYSYKPSGKAKLMVTAEWRIGTMDLETYIHNDISKVYAIGFCTKDSMKTFYIDKDFDSDALIMKCIDAILVWKYNGYIFYIHNLTNFDIYFLFRVLISNPEKYDCKPYIKDNSIIGLKLTSKENKYSIKIVDSANLLNNNLFDLCITFDTAVKKGYFPYKFVTQGRLFYVGDKPDYSFYLNINKHNNPTILEYNEIPSKGWDLQNETTIYLENDLKSLFGVMETFTRNVYRDYGIQVSNSLTISSLSMDIFLTKYYTGNGIPLIKDKSIYNDIKSSYFGGVTEVYKPYGKNLYYYDVNSLYPYAALNDMPGRDCTYISNIDMDLSDCDDYFGFFYCKVLAPEQYIGLLPYRSEEGLTMPTGQFEGWYFSEELKFALEHGYKIHVIRGYKFNRVTNVFNSYVRDLYNIKSSTNDPAEKAIVKSLLNHLLGKFGLDINKYVTELVSTEEFKSLVDNRKIRSFQWIDKDKVLVSYEKEINKNICESHGLSFKDEVNKYMDNSKNKNKSYKEESYHDVSVAISSSITSYSRIYMNRIKLNILSKGGSIYYTDTDSIVTDIPLDPTLVGNGLGEFKLVYEVIEGYFISNKTYGLIAKNGNENITIIKNKGVYKGELTYEDIKKLYNGNKVNATRYETKKSFSKGSAIFNIANTIILKPDSYQKRVKVFGNNNKWTDTKPIVKGYHTLNKIKK